jgi:hypothetical protein
LSSAERAYEGGFPFQFSAVTIQQDTLPVREFYIACTLLFLWLPLAAMDIRETLRFHFSFFILESL